MTPSEGPKPATTIHALSQPGAVSAGVRAVPLPPRRWKSRVLLPAGILTGAGGLFLAVGLDSLRPRTPVQVAPVVAKQVQGGAGAAQVQASGWLEPDPFPTYVSALVPGVVAELLVLEGAAVTSGQVVARLVDDAARIAVEQAEAELALAQAERAMAEANLAGVTSSNALLIDRRRDVDFQQARVAGGEATLRELEASIAAQVKTVAALRDEHERAVQLLVGGTQAEGQVTQLGLRLEGAAATLEALRRQVAVVEAELDQARSEARAARRHAETLVEEQQAAAVAEARAARERANVRRAEARLRDARLVLGRHVVRSPATGVVMSRLVAPGSRLMLSGDDPTGAHLIHLYDPARLQARVDVPLAEAAKVGVGQPARLRVETLPDRWFEGQVTRVVHHADVQKNTVEFKVRLDQPDPALKPDMLTRVRFLAQAAVDSAQGPERLFVPRSAVVGAGAAARVFVVRERRGDRGWAEPRSVELGAALGEDAVEVSGLRLGDEVVVSPPPDLADGDLLTVTGEAP